MKQSTLISLIATFMVGVLFYFFPVNKPTPNQKPTILPFNLELYTKHDVIIIEGNRIKSDLGIDTSFTSEWRQKEFLANYSALIVELNDFENIEDFKHEAIEEGYIFHN